MFFKTVLLFCSFYTGSVVAQPVIDNFSQRVIADESWGANENGMPVGLIGDMLLVGTRNHDEAGLTSGAVWSFKKVGNTWVQQQKILPENPENNMWFGFSLSVEQQLDNGEAWLAIGSPLYDNSKGRVDLYQREGDLWVYKQTLNGESGQYGWDVAINVDIPITQSLPLWNLVVGAPAHRYTGNAFNTGTVYISELNNLSLWTPGAIPIALETETSTFISNIGTSVAIDGDVVMAGASNQQVNGQNGAGAVYLFVRDDITLAWAINNWYENPDPVPNQMFGGANYGADVAVVKQIIPDNNFTGNYYYLVGAPTRTVEIEGGQMYIYSGGPAAFSTVQRETRPDREMAFDNFGYAVVFQQDLFGGDHKAIVSSRVQGNGAEGRVFIYNQTDLQEPWLPTHSLGIFDAGFGQLGNNASVGLDLAAWGESIVASAPNSVPNTDAVYSTPLDLIFKNGFP